MNKILSYGYKMIFNLDQIIVKPDTHFRKALKIMDSTNYGIVLISDAEGRLQGVLVDSDIRKLIIKGSSLDCPVEEAMNKKPSVLKNNFRMDEFINLTNNAKRRNLPVVDDNNILIALVTSVKWTEGKSFNNYVVIMVGGRGERLLPLTENVPKPMLRISEKPILEIIIGQLAKQGFQKFIFTLNHLGNDIKGYFKDGKDFNVSIEYVKENEELGTAGSLGLLRQDIKESLFVMNGDLLTKVDFRNILDFHSQEKCSATVCVVKYEISVPFGVLLQENHVVQGIVEKPVYDYNINAGIYLLEPDVLSLIPKGKYFDMTDLIKLMIKSKRPIMSFPIVEYWLDIGQHDDYIKAKIDYKKHF